jgi:hypothetical protein
MSMLQLLERMGYQKRTTVHGLYRASFSTWANDTDAARPDVIEACLTHRETDLVRAAYNRAVFHAERAALLRAWADFCEGRESAAKLVVTLYATLSLFVKLFSAAPGNGEPGAALRRVESYNSQAASRGRATAAVSHDPLGHLPRIAQRPLRLLVTSALRRAGSRG